MRIGIDFDNTIICYDKIFHDTALRRGLIPRDLPENKTAVRDYLREAGKEDRWTEIQGYVYGLGLLEAKPYPGLLGFLSFFREKQVPLSIISHKSRYPFAGEKYDLHEAARQWLKNQGFFDPDGIGITLDRVFFELSRERKIRRIVQSGCTLFIDDLPELLCDPRFPAHVRRILFDPWECYGGVKGSARATSWDALQSLVEKELYDERS